MTGVEGAEEATRCAWWEEPAREEGGGGGRRGNPAHCFFTGVVGVDLLAADCCTELRSLL